MIGLKNISHNNWKIGIHVPICHPQRDSDATELLSVVPVSWSYFIINSIPAKAGFLLLAAQGKSYGCGLTYTRRSVNREAESV